MSIKMKKIIITIMCLHFSFATASAQVLEATGKIPTSVSYNGRKIDGGSVAYATFIGALSVFTLGLPLVASGVMCADQAERGEEKCSLTESTTYSKLTDVPASILLSAWGEGRAKVIIQGKSSKGCAGYQMEFTGVEKSDGAFELYSELVPDKSVGEVLVTTDSVFLGLAAQATLQTHGKKGKICSWTILPDTAVNFKIKK